MKVKNDIRYLNRAKAKLVKMQESDFVDIDINALGRIAFNLTKWEEFRDKDNYTLRELITMFIKIIEKELEENNGKAYES